MRHKLLLPIISAILLILAYPSFNLYYVAWIALVPLFFALDNQSHKQRFVTGYVFGLVFFAGIVYWLANVSVPGAVLLILYLSLFPALFCVLSSSSVVHRPSSIVFIPAAWVSVEYLRAHLFTGFPWALLGYSQSFNLSVIQIADVTGVYGVSFLVVLMNLALYMTLKKYPKRLFALFFVLVLFIITFVYGQAELNRVYPVQSRTHWAEAPGRSGLNGVYPYQKLKIAVIQGNIPQKLKWDPNYRRFIIDKYDTLTRKAFVEKPNLVVWPEAALPGYIEEADLRERLINLAKSGNTNLLVGALSDRDSKFYNGAALISAAGEIVKYYDKIHLVPFGEFLPLENKFSWIRSIIDKPIGDFTRGSEFTAFKFAVKDVSRKPDIIVKTTEFHTFSALVCFEDIFPELVRNFVNKGARFLVNVTNDAWFGKTAAAYQHMQGSIFRAVENRVPVVRAANTGVSCIIDRRGNIIKSVKEKNKEIFVEGFVSGDINPVHVKTFYTRFGDVFSLLCIALVLIGFVISTNYAKKIATLTLAIIFVSSVALALSFPLGKKHDYNNILVRKVIDGDTIELENGERVRLIGMDTPESRYNEKLKRDAKRSKRDYKTIVAMGNKAAAFTKSLVEGKKVRLEFDVEKRDMYERLLAYVYLPDKKMLNAEILKAGYAKVYTFPPNVKYVDMFLELEREARENKRGFWGE